MARKAKAKKEDTTPVKEKTSTSPPAKVTPSKSSKTSRKTNTKAYSSAKRKIDYNLNTENDSKTNTQVNCNNINNNKTDEEQKRSQRDSSNASVKESDNKATLHTCTLSLPSVKVEELINRPANSPIVSLHQLRSLSLPTGARINIRSTQPQTSIPVSSLSFPTSSSAVAKEVALAPNPARNKTQEHYPVSSSLMLSSSSQLNNTSSQNDNNTVGDVNKDTINKSAGITSSSLSPPPPYSSMTTSVAPVEMENDAIIRPIRKPRSTFIWHNKRQEEEDSNAHKSVKARRNPRYTSSNNNRHRKTQNFSLQSAQTLSPPPPPPQPSVVLPPDIEPQEKTNTSEDNLRQSEKVKSIINLPESIISHTLEPHAIALQTREQRTSLAPFASFPSSTSTPAASSSSNNVTTLIQSVVSNANTQTSKSTPSPLNAPISATSHSSFPSKHYNDSTLVLPENHKQLSVLTQKMLPSTSAVGRTTTTTTTTTTPVPAVVTDVANNTVTSSAQEQVQTTAAAEFDNKNNNNNYNSSKNNFDNNYKSVFYDRWSSIPLNDNIVQNAINKNNDITVNNTDNNNNYSSDLIQMQNYNKNHYERSWEECSEEEQQQYYLQMQRHALSSEEPLQPSPFPPTTPTTSPPPPPPPLIFLPYAEEDDNNEEAEVVPQNSSWPATASEYLLYLQRREEMMRNEEESNNVNYSNNNNNGYDMYSAPANSFNNVANYDYNYNYNNYKYNGGNAQVSSELQNNWSNTHDDRYSLSPSTITSSSINPPCTSAETMNSNNNNLIENDNNNNNVKNAESDDTQSSRSKPSSIAQYRLTMMRLRAAQRPSSSSTNSDYLETIKKQIRTKIVQDARKAETDENMPNASTVTSNSSNNNYNHSFSDSTNNITIYQNENTAATQKTNASEIRRNKNKNNRNKSMNNSSINSRYSSNSNSNTYNKRYQTNKSRNEVKPTPNTRQGNKRKKQQSTVMPEHLPHTWSNVDQHAQKRTKVDYNVKEDNEETYAEKEKCNKLYSTSCDISANNNNSKVSESTLSDLRRCISNCHPQEQQQQPLAPRQQETLSSSTANSLLYANNTSVSPTTLSAPLAHLLGSWNSSSSSSLGNSANVENGTWTSYRTFSPAHLSTPATSAPSTTSMVNVGNIINNQSVNANEIFPNRGDVELHQESESTPHLVDKSLPISQRNLLSLKPNLSHVSNDTIFRDEAVIGAGNVVSEEPNSFAALRNAWIAASAALATSTSRSEWQLPSSSPNEQNGMQQAMYISPIPSPQPSPELTINNNNIKNNKTDTNSSNNLYSSSNNGKSNNSKNNNNNNNGIKQTQFQSKNQKNASFSPEKDVRCVVMDTCSLLDADPGMLNLLIEKWKLCIPYTVIDELDNLNKSIIRDARRLTTQQRAEREQRQKRARELRNWLMSVTVRKGNMIRFQKRAEVIEEYFKRSSNNDDAILGFAVFLRSEAANVVFVTEDKFLRLKAQSELGEVFNNKQLKQLLRLRY